MELSIGAGTEPDSGLALRTDVWLDASIGLVATTVLIVDDHEGFRARARSLLESEGYTVIGEASSGASALDAARALGPDLVLLDVMLPDASGFEVSQRMRRLETPPRVVLVSSHEASDFGRRLDAAAAIGFIPKVELSGRRLRSLLDTEPS